MHLVTATKLSELHRLTFASSLPAARVHAAMVAQNPALLSRLTALKVCAHSCGPRMTRSRDAEAAHAESNAAWLADMPALRSLSVGYNRLGVTELECLAAVLPRLSGLTHLAVHLNHASHVGVAEIVVAAEKLQAAAGAGRLGLRLLDISSCDLRAVDVAQLARLLSRLHRLEALNLTDTHLAERARQGTLKVLETLPQLRRLRADRDVPYHLAGDFEAAAVAARFDRVSLD